MPPPPAAALFRSSLLFTVRAALFQLAAALDDFRPGGLLTTKGEPDATTTGSPWTLSILLTSSIKPLLISLSSSASDFFPPARQQNDPGEERHQRVRVAPRRRIDGAVSNVEWRCSSSPLHSPSAFPTHGNARTGSRHRASTTGSSAKNGSPGLEADRNSAAVSGTGVTTVRARVHSMLCLTQLAESGGLELLHHLLLQHVLVLLHCHPLHVGLPPSQSQQATPPPPARGRVGTGQQRESHAERAERARRLAQTVETAVETVETAVGNSGGNSGNSGGK